MKKVAGALLSLGMFGSVALADLNTGVRPNGPCTMDFNPWGNPGLCACPEGMVYNQKAFLCFDESKPLPKIMTQGVLVTRAMAIGGETTGFELTTPGRKTYELILSLAQKSSVEHAGGLFFEVEGEEVGLPGVERNPRPAIIVDDLRILE